MISQRRQGKVWQSCQPVLSGTSHLAPWIWICFTYALLTFLYHGCHLSPLLKFCHTWEHHTVPTWFSSRAILSLYPYFGCRYAFKSSLVAFHIPQVQLQPSSALIPFLHMYTNCTDWLYHKLEQQYMQLNVWIKPLLFTSLCSVLKRSPMKSRCKSTCQGRQIKNVTTDRNCWTVVKGQEQHTDVMKMTVK